MNLKKELNFLEAVENGLDFYKESGFVNIGFSYILNSNQLDYISLRGYRHQLNYYDDKCVSSIHITSKSYLKKVSNIFKNNK